MEGLKAADIKNAGLLVTEANDDDLVVLSSFDGSGDSTVIKVSDLISSDVDDGLATKVNKAGDTMTGLLQFSGTGHAGLKLNSLTTTQRNALTASNGMVIYNTTTAQFEKYQAGAWLSMGKSTAVVTIAAYNTPNGAARADYVCASDFAESTINAAIATLPATGGVVQFLEGIFPIRGSINVPSFTLLKGCGRGGATKIFKVINGFSAIKFEGAGVTPPDYMRSSGMENITVEGNAKTGYLLECKYAQTLFFSRCEFNGANDTAIRILQTQDSYFHQITANTNHSDTGPVMIIEGGNSDSSNMLWFSQIRFEDFWKGAVWIRQGSGYSGNNNGFFFSQVKFESTSVNGDLFTADSSILELHINQAYFFAGGFRSPWSTAVYGVNSGAKGSVSFVDCSMNSPALIGAGVLNLNVPNGNCRVENILYDGTPTVAVVNFNGSSSGTFQVGGLGKGGGAFTAGHASGVSTYFLDTVIQASLTLHDELIVNENGGDFDTRFEGDNDPNLLYLDAGQDFVGIGTASPVNKLHVSRANGAGDVAIRIQNNATTADETASLIFSTTTSTTQAAALIAKRVDGSNNTLTIKTAVGGVLGERINIGTADVVINEGGDDMNLRIEGDTDADLFFIDAGLDAIGIGINTPAAKLHIDQASATGAKPVLYLDQEDVSEEFFRFASTTGVGNALETVGSKTLTVTHFIKININGVIRYLQAGTIA